MSTQSLAALTIGGKAPGFTLPSVTDSATYSLQSFEKYDVLVVIFLANHCPYVSSWEDRMIALAREYISKSVGFVAISASDVDKFPQDGPDAMRTRAKEMGYPFPYLHDADQSVARSFGATRTPEVFAFDRDRVLKYHGAIDSDYEESPENLPYLKDAIDQLIAGQQVALADTPPIGCTIKFK